jgi:phosphoadenosine phosphosulfate reductase
LSPQRTLGSAIEWLGASQVALVSSFGTDSAVLLHMMSEINPSNPVIFLDTEFHFDETLRYLEDLVDRLGLTGIQRARIDPVSRKRLDPDQQLHRRDPDRCCQARKVEVLDRALKGFQGWISGQKRFQSSLRNDG